MLAVIQLQRVAFRCCSDTEDSFAAKQRVLQVFMRCLKGRDLAPLGHPTPFVRIFDTNPDLELLTRQWHHGLPPDDADVSAVTPLQYKVSGIHPTCPMGNDLAWFWISFFQTLGLCSARLPRAPLFTGEPRECKSCFTLLESGNE